MKRLIKKSTNENLEEMIDLIEGLAKWCQWDLGTLDVNRMLELNPDCVYNGKLYRGMGTQGYDVLDIIEETNIEFPITWRDDWEKYGGAYKKYINGVEYRYDQASLFEYLGTPVDRIYINDGESEKYIWDSKY